MQLQADSLCFCEGEMRKASTILLKIAIFSTLAFAQEDATPVQVVGLGGKKLSLTSEVVSQFARVESRLPSGTGPKPVILA